VLKVRKGKLTIACAEAVEDKNFLWKAPEKKEKMATALKTIGETPEKRKTTSEGLPVGRRGAITFNPTCARGCRSTSVTCAGFEDRITIQSYAI
jgi:hypothetical protein